MHCEGIEMKMLKIGDKIKLKTLYRDGKVGLLQKTSLKDGIVAFTN